MDRRRPGPAAGQARRAGRSGRAPAAARSATWTSATRSFEIFSSPRSGDLTAARIFRYRDARRRRRRVLARFDDGGVAVAERKVERGTVIAWTSTFDSYWNDLPLKPVFVPLVHQVMRHLGRYVEPRPWYSVGDTYDPADAPPARTPAAGTAAGGAFTALSPSGPRRRTGHGRRHARPCRWPRPASTRSGRRPPAASRCVVAVNGAAGRVRPVAARSRPS